VGCHSTSGCGNSGLLGESRGRLRLRRPTHKRVKSEGAPVYCGRHQRRLLIRASRFMGRMRHRERRECQARASTRRMIGGALASFRTGRCLVFRALTALLRLLCRCGHCAAAARAASFAWPSRFCGSLRSRMREAMTVRRICAVPPPIVNMRASRAMRSNGRLRE